MPRPLTVKSKVAPSRPAYPRADRLLAAASLVGSGMAAIHGGAGAMPWVANLAAYAGFPRGFGPRLLAGVLYSLAAMIILAPSWSRRLALVASAIVFFAGVATVSGIRATRLAGPDGPGLSAVAALVVAGAALTAAIIAGWVCVRAYRSSSPESRGLSTAWRISAAFLSLGAGLAIAAPPTATPAPGVEPPRFEPPASAREVESIDLEVAAWVGRPLGETPIAAHLPGMVGLVGGDRVLLVLYNARCGTCHALFRERFAGDLAGRVIAIEIPPAADAVPAAGDGEGEIECPGCERLSLPAGPRWLVRPPTVVRVEGGIVTCVDDASTGSCFGLTP